jgi:hypothetical protein
MEKRAMTRQEYDNEMRGVLFRNKNKHSEKSPDYTGTCEIEGKELRIAGWKQHKKSDGEMYLSLAFSFKEDEGQRAAPGGAQEEHTEDDIPF